MYTVYKCISQGIKISFILSDQTMKYMKGTTSLEIIQEMLINKNIKAIPLFLITAYENFQYTNENVKVLSKPLSKEMCTEILNLTVENK